MIRFKFFSEIHINFKQGLFLYFFRLTVSLKNTKDSDEYSKKVIAEYEKEIEILKQTQEEAMVLSSNTQVKLNAELRKNEDLSSSVVKWEEEAKIEKQKVTSKYFSNLPHFIFDTIKI